MPRRRCVGCGRVAPKSELVRLALVSGEANRDRRVAIDWAGRMPGRGAYLCREATLDGPARSCVELSARRGGVARALRCSAKMDIEDLVESKAP